MSYWGDLLWTSADLSMNSLSLSSSATRSILCINIKILASGEHRSIASITFTNKVMSFPGSAESMSERIRITMFAKVIQIQADNQFLPNT